MREHLLGYLLGALDGPEQQQVEDRLEQDPQLQKDLAALDAHVDLLRHGNQSYQPPEGLAKRTCDLVHSHCQQQTNSRQKTAAAQNQYSAAPGVRGWSLADLVVAAGIFLAASLLFWPAIANSHNQAQIDLCQNNLQQIGRALQRYVHDHDNYYPRIPDQGKLSAAGLVGPILQDVQLLENPKWLLCPASQLAQLSKDFKVPSCQELKDCDGATLQALKQNMGGSYAFPLGYTEAGFYQTPQHLGRPHFAIASDAPGHGPQRQSGIHGRWGQNVLFDDFHVQFVKGCMLQDCGDDFFVNRNGQIAAGLDLDDAVLAGSATPPLIRTIALPARNRP